MIRPERLTIKAQEAFRDAGEVARRRGNPVVNDAHLLAALLAQDEGRGAAAAPEGRPQRHRAAGGSRARDRPLPQARAAGAEPTFSREVHRVFDRAEQEAKKLGDAYVSTEHLLLALAEEKGTTARALLSAPDVYAGRSPGGARGRARLAPGDRPDARGEVPGARALHPQPHRAGPARESSIRSSAGTRRSAGSCRCSPAAPRTIRC